MLCINSQPSGVTLAYEDRPQGWQLRYYSTLFIRKNEVAVSLAQEVYKSDAVYVCHRLCYVLSIYGTSCSMAFKQLVCLSLSHSNSLPFVEGSTIITVFADEFG